MQLLSRIKRIRPGRTQLILGVAIVIGLAAAWAAKSFLNHRVADIEARAKGRTVDVVVAKTDLPRGAVLDADTAAVRKIPVQYAHSDAITPDDFERAEGEPLAYPVKSGEMILWSLLETKKTPTFSTRVEMGRRAITVPVDEINSISGMLEPGDIIDLYMSLDYQGRKITLPLLQAVEVMATGQRAIDDPKSGERREFTTVTLDTTPEQAQSVIVARDTGRITALLRNPQDKKPLPEVRGDVAGLLGLKARFGGADAKTPLVLADQQVPVLYGGQGHYTDEQLTLARARSQERSVAGPTVPATTASDEAPAISPALPTPQTAMTAAP